MRGLSCTFSLFSELPNTKYVFKTWNVPSKNLHLIHPPDVMKKSTMSIYPKEKNIFQKKSKIQEVLTYSTNTEEVL